MAKKLTEKQALEVVDIRMKALCGAALADPDVNPQAKSLAGYWLKLLSGSEKSSSEGN